MKNNHASWKKIARLFSVIIALAILLTAVPTVYAEGDGPLTPIPGLGRVPNATLILMHRKVGGWLVDQETIFVQAGQLSANFQTLIHAQAKAGKDVTLLNIALANFDAEVAVAREINGTAGVTIYSLTGWKASGDVRDRLAAGQSLLDGREQVKDANFRLTNAMTILRKSLDWWRNARLRGEQ